MGFIKSLFSSATAYFVVAILLLSSSLVYYIKKTSALEFQVKNIAAVNSQWANRYAEIPKYFKMLDTVDLGYIKEREYITKMYAEYAKKITLANENIKWDNNLVPDVVYNSVSEYSARSVGQPQNNSSQISKKTPSS